MKKSAIKCGNLITAISGEKEQQKDKVIIVRDGMITNIIDETPKNFDGEVYDFSQQSVMPGLINCHTHICFRPDPDPNKIVECSDAEIALIAAENAKEYLYSGVTTIRDMGGVNYVDIVIKDYINKGIIKGSDVFASGLFLTMTGGHGNTIGLECDGIDECRKGARKQLKNGADIVKIMATGGVLTKGVEPGSPQLTYEEMKAAVDEAHKAGKKTAAHAQGVNGIKNAIRAGIDSIEHGFYMDQEAIDMMVDNGVFYIPTFCPPHFINKYGVESGISEDAVVKVENSMEAHKHSFKMAMSAGVKIAVGTDGGTPFNLHSATYKEVSLMCENGMSNYDAIISATRNGAECIGVDDRGTIEVGKRADILIVDGSPLDDIQCLEKVHAVFKEGIKEF